MMMMHHKAPHRNQAAPARYLGYFEGKNFSIPETYFDQYATRCPASASAENKVKNLYWSNDLKLDLPEGMDDPGIGGGSTFGFNATQSYEAFLKRMNDEQRKKWEDFYEPVSQAFFNANKTGMALEVDIYQRMMRDYMQSVAAVDESVGHVLDYLEETDQLDNTLIVYTSD